VTGGWGTRPVVAARVGLLVLLVLVPVAALFGALVDGRDGAAAAALGLTVPGTVLLVTWVAAELGARRSAQAFAALLLGSYVVKLVAVVGLLVVLDRAQVGSPTVTGLSAVAGLVVALVAEALVVARTRAPYVEP
jgi:hypothetical protein